jgi:hypothetical protein
VSKPLGQLLLLGVAGFFIYLPYSRYAAVDFSGASAALVSLGRREGGPDGRIADFGLLWDGCKVEGGISFLLNGTAVAYYPRSVRANGYFFVTSDGLAAEDPVKWVTSVSATVAANASAAWRLVGASGWSRVWGNPYLKVTYPTPTERGLNVAVDRR